MRDERACRRPNTYMVGAACAAISCRHAACFRHRLAWLDADDDGAMRAMISLAFYARDASFTSAPRLFSTGRPFFISFAGYFACWLVTISRGLAGTTLPPRHTPRVAHAKYLYSAATAFSLRCRLSWPFSASMSTIMPGRQLTK